MPGFALLTLAAESLFSVLATAVYNFKRTTIHVPIYV
jgi:hypothetical protein